MKRFQTAVSLAVPSIVMIIACGPPPPLGTGGTSGSGGTSANAFCAVQRVLETRCQSCHTNPPIAGAPFPLVTYADTQAIRPGSNLPVWQRMQQRVDAGLMPPAGVTPLDPNEKATLDTWFNSGAKGSDCPLGTGGTGGASGSGGWAGYGGIGALPCSVTRSFKAHAPGNLNAKYNVAPGTTNVYKCFTFKNTLAANELITAQRPAADNLGVIHHFILFGVDSGIDGDITESGCYSPQINGQQLEGWAPGGTNDIFPDDLATRITHPFVTLQIHYNTPVGGQDASGIEYCTTTQSRPNIAKVVTLGSDAITIPGNAADATAVGMCSGLPTNGQPVFVVGTSPHMHLLGNGFTTEVVGTGTLLSNIPLGQWSFEAQRHYRIDRYQLNPGQQLRTTCHYKNPSGNTVRFGPATTDEMCYDFFFVYPDTGSKTECGTGPTFSSG
jgi:hypothetical protein